MHNLPNHFNKEGHFVENSKEKERFNQHHENDCNHQQLRWNTHNIRRKPLHRDIGKSKPNMGLIQPVPRVGEVVAHALFEALQEVVDSWVNQANAHGRAQTCSVFVVSVHVYVV